MRCGMLSQCFYGRQIKVRCTITRFPGNPGPGYAPLQHYRRRALAVQKRAEAGQSGPMWSSFVTATDIPLV